MTSPLFLLERQTIRQDKANRTKAGNTHAQHSQRGPGQHARNLKRNARDAVCVCISTIHESKHAHFPLKPCVPPTRATNSDLRAHALHKILEPVTRKVVFPRWSREKRNALPQGTSHAFTHGTYGHNELITPRSGATHSTPSPANAPSGGITSHVALLQCCHSW